MEKGRSCRSDDGVKLILAEKNISSGWRAGGGWGGGGSHECLKWRQSLTAETWLADSVRGRICLVKWRGSTWRNTHVRWMEGAGRDVNEKIAFLIERTLSFLTSIVQNIIIILCFRNISFSTQRCREERCRMCYMLTCEEPSKGPLAFRKCDHQYNIYGSLSPLLTFWRIETQTPPQDTLYCFPLPCFVWINEIL